MSFTHQDERSEASEPRRGLRSDFTKQVLRNAIVAKRRIGNRQRRRALRQELFSMKSINFLRTIPGAALAVAGVAAGSVGVYALSNWFGGTVTVSQKDPTVFSVDLSSCKGNLPPGVESTGDRSKVQFKIMGDPHISAEDLQQTLLGECEFGAVAEFYSQKFPDSHFSNPEQATTQSQHYTLLTATIQSINDSTIELSTTGAKGSGFATRAFTMAPDLTVYSSGRLVTTRELKVGDNVAFVAYTASPLETVNEGTSPLNNSDVQIVSLFKTQYNDGAYWTLNYQRSNIMPLDTYNQLPNGQPYK